MPDPMVAAREQACESVGFMASKKIVIGDEVFEIPNPSLLDDEQEKRYSQLQLDLETDPHLDRLPDVVDADGKFVRLGNPKEPLRTTDGKLAESFNSRLAKAILGPQTFKRFIAAGGRSADINLYWTEMQQKLADRRRNDSKSVDGNRRLAPVPDSD